MQPASKKFKALAKLITPSGLLSKSRLPTPKKPKSQNSSPQSDDLPLSKTRACTKRTGMLNLKASPLKDILKNSVTSVEGGALSSLIDPTSTSNNESLSLQEFDRLCRTYSTSSKLPSIKYLVASKKYNIVPQSILVSHLWGVETEIDFNGRGLNDDYIEAFAETVEGGLRPGVHTIRLKRNR